MSAFRTFFFFQARFHAHRAYIYCWTEVLYRVFAFSKLSWVGNEKKKWKKQYWSRRMTMATDNRGGYPFFTTDRVRATRPGDSEPNRRTRSSQGTWSISLVKKMMSYPFRCVAGSYLAKTKTAREKRSLDRPRQKDEGESLARSTPDGATANNKKAPELTPPPVPSTELKQTCSVPTWMWGCEGLWSYGYGHACISSTRPMPCYDRGSTFSWNGFLKGGGAPSPKIAGKRKKEGTSFLRKFSSWVYTWGHETFSSDVSFISHLQISFFW